MQHAPLSHAVADLHIDFAMPRVDARDAPNLPQVQTSVVQSLRLAVLSIWHRWRELEDRVSSLEDLHREATRIIHDTQRIGAEVGLPVTCREDLDDPRRTVLHHLEGADAIGRRERGFYLEEEIRALSTLGIRCITPIYSQGNHFGGGSNQLSDGRHRLTLLGMHLVDLAQKYGIAIDTSHMNVETREDVLDLVGKDVPIAYTHGGLDMFTCFRDGREQERGIPLKQLERIRASGGIIGLSVTRPFITSAEEFDTTLDVLLNARLGSRGIAIGTDFGGVHPNELLTSLTNHHDVVQYLTGRVERGDIAEEHLAPLLCGNVLAFFARTLKSREELTALRVI